MGNEKEKQELEIVRTDARLISKWFDDTAEAIERDIHPQGRVDMICITAMSVSANYSNACVDLLLKGYHMPVKAMLRILCELSAKLAWCLVTPKTKKKRQIAAIEKKIDQWEKNTLHGEVRVLEEFRSIVSHTQKFDLEEEIISKKMKMKSLPGHRMPKTIEIFNRLPRNWRRGIYPRGFLQFNNAIHIDLSTLASRITQDGDQINIDFDSTENISELSGYCLSFMYQILLLVRLHFGWETKDMERDFHENSRNGHYNAKIDEDQ